MKTIVSYALFLFALPFPFSMLGAELQAGCCVRCGVTCDTHQVCRTVYSTKSVEYIEWGEVCHEVCLPPRTQCAGNQGGGLSGLLGKHFGTSVCDDADGAVNCDDPELSHGIGSGRFNLFRNLGDCDLRPKKKLMRKTLVAQVPVVECVVEEVCGHCSNGGNLNQASGGFGSVTTDLIQSGVAPQRGAQREPNARLADPTIPVGFVQRMSSDLSEQSSMAPVMPAPLMAPVIPAPVIPETDSVPDNSLPIPPVPFIPTQNETSYNYAPLSDSL